VVMNEGFLIIRTYRIINKNLTEKIEEKWNLKNHFEIQIIWSEL
jgi:hypothetical protein